MAPGPVPGRPAQRRRLRTLLIVLATLTLAGALLLGVASAGGPEGAGGPAGAAGPAGPAGPGASEATRAPGARVLPGLRGRWRDWLAARGQVAGRPAARRPLHALILARLSGREGRPPPAGRVLLGRLLALDGESATIAPGAGEPVAVRVTAQTRLPQRRPRVGEGVLVVGQPQPDGTWVARAVLLRRAGR